MVTTQFFAMKARRYLDTHGLPDEVLGQVAAKAFARRRREPRRVAAYRLHAQEIMAARVINPPLTQYMLCSPAEGAAAVILTSAERAADLTDRPVALRLGVDAHPAVRVVRGVRQLAAAGGGREPERRGGAYGVRQGRHRARRRPGGAAAGHRLRRRDHPHGRDRAVRARRTGRPPRSRRDAIKGRLPVNTDGGCLANGEPVGASGLRQVHEIVLQLRGTAGDRQVPGDPRVGFTHVYGAPGISACTVLTV